MTANDQQLSSFSRFLFIVWTCSRVLLTSLCLIVFLSLASWYPLLSPENDNISKSKTFFMFFLLNCYPTVAQLITNLYCIYTRLTRVINNHRANVSGSYPRKKLPNSAHCNIKRINWFWVHFTHRAKKVKWLFGIFSFMRNNLTNVHVSPCQREKFLFISNYKLSSNWHLN